MLAKLKSGNEIAASVLTVLQESADESVAAAAKSAKSVDIDIEVSWLLDQYGLFRLSVGDVLHLFILASCIYDLMGKGF